MPAASATATSSPLASSSSARAPASRAANARGEPGTRAARGERHPARGRRLPSERLVAGFERGHGLVQRAERVARAPQETGEGRCGVESRASERREHERLGRHVRQEIGAQDRARLAARARRGQLQAGARLRGGARPTPGASECRAGRVHVAREQPLAAEREVGQGLEPEPGQRGEKRERSARGPRRGPREAPVRQARARAPARRAIRAAWYCGSACARMRTAASRSSLHRT